jgi:hypothetical protein
MSAIEGAQARSRPEAGVGDAKNPGDRRAGGGGGRLEVMLADMRAKYAAGDLDAATDRACDCAPYTCIRA